MKVDAIANCGSRWDFIDLYVAATRHGLGQTLEWFAACLRRSPTIACTFDAERDPPPDLLVPIDWAAVKGFFKIGGSSTRAAELIIRGAVAIEARCRRPFRGTPAI